MQAPRIGSPRTRGVAGLGVFGAAVLLALVPVYIWRFELLGGAMFVANRAAEGCSREGAIGGFQAADRQFKLLARFEQEMRLLETGAGYERWQTPLGVYWTPKGKMGILAGNLAEQARGIYSAYGLGVKAGDVVLDCGANVGVFTRAALLAGAARVLAIEPVPDNLESLRRTFASEIADGKVTLVEKGVWDRDDFLEMYQDDANNAIHSFVVDWRKRGVTLRLPLTTIDRIVEQLALKDVDYIKMDIEGAERRALAGAADTIRRFRPRMALCVYHLKDDPAVIPARVLAASPDYRHRCGPCFQMQGMLRPEVFFFYPD